MGDLPTDEGVMTTEFVHWMVTATESEVFDFSQRGSPRCSMCGRVEAAEDCEDDPLMCWWAVNGTDSRCDLLRTHYAAVSRAVESGRLRASETDLLGPVSDGGPDAAS